MKKTIMSIEEHRIHAQRLKSAYVAIFEVMSSPLPKTHPAQRKASRAADIVAGLRYALESQMIKDHGTFEGWDKIYPAACDSDLWMPGQPLGKAKGPTEQGSNGGPLTSPNEGEVKVATVDPA